MAQKTQKQKLANTIGDLLNEIEKLAESNTEVGSIGGDSTHPSAKVDDQTQDATEGSRTTENKEDIKKDVGNASVDSAKENKGGTAAQDQVQVGMNPTPTGEDPANETASAGTGNFDPGSTHPARVDNQEVGSGKYASEREELRALCKMAQEIGVELLADIATQTKQAAPNAGPKPQPQAAAKSASQAGYDLANALTDEQEKQAADYIVLNTVYDIRNQAIARAEKVAEFLEGRRQAIKRAEDPTEQVDPNAMPTSAEPGADGGDGDIEAQIAALLAGGGDMGAEDAAEGMGAPPPGGGAAAGDMGDAGGMPPGGDGDGDEISPEDLAMLEQILQEENVQDPAALAAKAGSAAPKAFNLKTASAAQKKKYAAYKAYIQELKAR